MRAPGPAPRVLLPRPLLLSAASQPQATRSVKKAATSRKPTLAEVQAYAADQYPGPAAHDEAAAFIGHFESNGWLVGG